MGKKSVKENKNPYHTAREDLGLTREKASELLETIAPDRIEKIESEKSVPHADEVLIMANKYKKPTLRNYYCSQQCPIGRAYVPTVEEKGALSSIVVQVLASLNAVSNKKDRLVEIAVDEKIGNDEIDDFIAIQDELERISITVETLQLWVEKMLAQGIIDPDVYRAKKNKD